MVAAQEVLQAQSNNRAVSNKCADDCINKTRQAPGRKALCL